VLTVDFGRVPVGPGVRVLDLGCGAGRHAFEAYRRGASVVAFDQDVVELESVADMFAAMAEEGQVPASARAEVMKGDALALPYDDASFDVVIASELLEHLPDDRRAMAEISRVVTTGGRVVVTVPRWWPERICWALSADYHTVEGGHVRIYTGRELAGKLRAVGLEPYDRHHAHALHSPYWWLKCAVGVHDDGHLLPRLYHRLLVWDIVRRPAVTRAADRLLNPLMGKSLVLYLRKPGSFGGAG
jgi:SAM-dependent methyltransferase